jgi:MSHA pilin protein MshC
MRAAHGHPGCARTAGFTIVEFVTVMVVVGILASFAIPRLTDRYGTDERGFYDQVQAALRYGQKITLATRRNVCVTINAGTATLALRYRLGAVCGPAVPAPGSNTAYTITAPAGVALSSSSPAFDFDSASGGGPLPNVTQIVTVGNRRVTVEAVTGYVH